MNVFLFYQYSSWKFYTLDTKNSYVFFSVLLYQLPLWMLTSLPIVSHSGGSVTGLVVGIISAALLIAVAVITLGILCK